MKSLSFQVRMGCVVLTKFAVGAQIGSTILPDAWEVSDPVQLERAIGHQVRLMEAWWMENTEGRVKVCHKLHMAEEPARRIDLENGRLLVDQPPPALLAGARLLTNAMVYYFWLPLPRKVSKSLTADNRRAHMTGERFAWFPFVDDPKRDWSKLRTGLTHELKEWFRSLLSRMRVNLPEPDYTPAFMLEFRRRFTDEVAGRLCSQFPRDVNWDDCG